MDALADTPTLLSWLLNVLVVATGVAAAAVMVCAVVAVAARLRSNDPVATTPARTSDAPEATVSGPGVSTATGVTTRTGDSTRTGDTTETGDSTETGTAQGADKPVDEPQRPQLPVGAEAALNAIVELRPDPRNVVVTHRDPTGEVRLYPLSESPPDADSDRFERSA